MSLDAVLRKQTRERFARLVKEGGPGWHPYCLNEAEKIVRADPMVHGGLVAAVEAEIGPEKLPAARKALDWFRKQGAK